MNFLDIIIIIPLGIAVFKGFRKGLIIELASLAALFIGIYAGIYFSDYIAEFLIKNFGLNANYTKAVAFTLIFIGVLIIVRLIAKAIEKLINLVAMGFFNKILGAIFSVIKYAFLLSIIFYLFNKFDYNEKILTHKSKESSVLYKPVSIIAPLSIPVIKKEYNKWKVQDSIPLERKRSAD